MTEQGRTTFGFRAWRWQWAGGWAWSRQASLSSKVLASLDEAWLEGQILLLKIYIKYTSHRATYSLLYSLHIYYTCRNQTPEIVGRKRSSPKASGASTAMVCEKSSNIGKNEIEQMVISGSPNGTFFPNS